MTNRMQAGILAAMAICAGLVAELSIYPAHSARAAAIEKARRNLQTDAKKGDTVATQHAAGPFDVKITPQGEPDKADGSTLARMSIEKQYHGDLEASAKGEMLTAGTDVKGSAGYVAIERVTGKLGGRSGSFVLQHSATLTRGAPVQNITVVPDSGAGELLGLTGKLTVIIEGGKHSYDFEYALTPAR